MYCEFFNVWRCKMNDNNNTKEWEGENGSTLLQGSYHTWHAVTLFESRAMT